MFRVIFFSIFGSMKKTTFLFSFLLLFSELLFPANQLDSLRNILDKNISDSLRFEVYNLIFPVVVKQNIDSAKNCLGIQNRILKEVKFNESTKNEFFIDFYNNSGIYYNRTGKQDSAIVFHQKSYDICTRIGKKRAGAITLNNIANIYYLQGNYQAALDYHLRA